MDEGTLSVRQDDWYTYLSTGLLFAILICFQDHVLGRPSVQFRKIQVLGVVAFWSLYLVKYVIAQLVPYFADGYVGAISMARQRFASYRVDCLSFLRLGKLSS